MTRARATRFAFDRLLRGISARRWSSAALLLTGTLTVAAATLGPLYARAAQETVLFDSLASAPPTATGLHVEIPTDLAFMSSVDTALRATPPPGFLGAYPDRTVGYRIATSVRAPGSHEKPQHTRVIWRDGQCDHLVLVRGRCPTGPGEAVLSERTLAGPYGYVLGGTAQLPLIPAAGPDRFGDDDPAPPTTLTVVGVYRPADPDDPFWFGRRYFNAAKAFGDGPDTVDAVIVDRAAYAGFGVGAGVLDADYPLDVTRVRLSDQDTLRAAVSDVVDRTTGAGVVASSDLERTLSAVDADDTDVAVGSLLVSLQLTALALFVLFVATSDALDGRGGDVALAKLRGLGPFATLRFLMTETVLLLAFALPLGAVLGLAVTHVLAGALLVHGLPVVFPAAGWAAAGCAFLGAMLAAGLAGRRVLRRSVLAQWRGTPRTPRRALLAEGSVAAAAVTSLALLGTGSSGPAALLAPGLLVLAVALVGVRLVPVVVGLGVPRTAGSARLGRFLALRQVARRPAALRLAVLLTIAIGLAVSGVAGETIAAGNRVARARVEVGAARTVAVQFDAAADPLALTQAADPDGRWAMTAAVWLPAGGNTVTGAVEGVDPTQLAAVAFPTTRGPALATIAHDLDPEPVDPIRVTGSALTVTVTTSDLTGSAPYVEVQLQPRSGAQQRIRLGTLRDGRQTYTGRVPCTDTCVVGGFGWTRPSSSFGTIGASVVVERLAVSSGGAAVAVDLGLRSPSAWRPRSPDATDDTTTGDVAVRSDGVHDTFTSTGGGSAGLAHASGPFPLPVWASTGAIVRPPADADGSAGVPGVTDSDGNAYPLTPVGTTDALPGIHPGGVLADLRSLDDQLPGFRAEARWSVWLGADAPPDALDRLRAAGFVVGAVTSQAERVDLLARQGPALALDLLLAGAVAAAVLAIGATATAISTSGRRRSSELAALRVLGVSRAALIRATVSEQGLLLGSAFVFGVPAGVTAAVLTMPVIPQFSDDAPLPLRDTPAWGPLVLVAGAFLILLAATSVAAGVSLVRAAVPARLREATQ